MKIKKIEKPTQITINCNSPTKDCCPLLKLAKSMAELIEAQQQTITKLQALKFTNELVEIHCNQKRLSDSELQEVLTEIR